MLKVVSYILMNFCVLHFWWGGGLEGSVEYNILLVVL